MKPKKLIALLLTFAFAGCSANFTPESSQSDSQKQEEQAIPPAEDKNAAAETTVKEEHDDAFGKYLDEYVVKMCEEDYTTMHHYFEHPEKYGIDPSKCKVTLGTFIETDEEKAVMKSLMDDFGKINKSDLSQGQSVIYDQLAWSFDIYKEADKPEYDYVGNIWSGLRGVNYNLVQFFSEYNLREEADVKPLIELINDTPRYIQDALDYSKVQADQDNLHFQYDKVIEDIQSVIDTKDTSSMYEEMDDEVDSLDISDEKKQEYKDQIRQAMTDSFFPAFEQAKSGLEALKDKVKKPTGLANVKDGKSYYSLLLKNSVGTDEDPEDMAAGLMEELETIQTSYFRIQHKDDSVLEKAQNLKTDFENVDDILPFLADHYESRFPKVDAMEYNLQPLDEDQSQKGVVAYFVTPAVDATNKYQIRYNKRDYGDDPTSISLYQTMAHEGIPGHMYQAQFDKEHYTHPAQYFLGCLGFSEGYATYVENQALYFLDLDETAREVYILDSQFSNYLVAAMDIDINYNGISLEQFREDYGEGMDDLYYSLADDPAVYPCYYYGEYKISKMYQDAKDKMGDKFSAVDFNNALLSSGEVNFNLIQKAIDRYTAGKDKV